jgi:hypothetical protein
MWRKMMRTNDLSKLLLMGAIMATPLAAQVGPSAESSSLHMSITATYTPARFGQVNGGSFWVQGGGFQIQARVGDRLGMVTDARTFHTSNINASGEGLSFTTITAGPQYTLPLRRNMAVYGQFLFGGSMATGLFPQNSGLQTSASGLALFGGGGLEMRLSDRVFLRAIEADRMRTHLPNGVSNTQNALVLGAGIVYWFR